MKKWNKKQIIISLVLGVLLGVAIGRWSLIGFHHRFGPPEKRFERKMKFFSKKLNLTPDQSEKIRKIFEEKHAKVKVLHAEVRPRFKFVRDTAREEIREILNENQKKTFAALEEKRKKKREKFKKKYGHPYRRYWR